MQPVLFLSTRLKVIKKNAIILYNFYFTYCIFIALINVLLKGVKQYIAMINS